MGVLCSLFYNISVFRESQGNLAEISWVFTLSFTLSWWRWSLGVELDSIPTTEKKNFFFLLIFKSSTTAQSDDWKLWPWLLASHLWELLVSLKHLSITSTNLHLPTQSKPSSSKLYTQGWHHHALWCMSCDKPPGDSHDFSSMKKWWALAAHHDSGDDRWAT